MATAAKLRFPPQIKYIIGNEACERFSFYGMRNILTVFLADYLLRNAVPDEGARKTAAKEAFHLFVMGVYFFPLMGGYLADRFWGKYRTILWLSLVYCLGHLALALFVDNQWGFYGGLFLIALGSGGIKPCVSSFVGDQFTESNKQLVNKVFALFYWSINFGSFFASLFIPKTLKLYGPEVAFGIPGVLMFVATVLFWLGRRQYTRMPPTGANPHSFFKVLRSAVRRRGSAQGHWLDAATPDHPAESILGAKAVLRVLAVFAPVPFFWMLFDQKASAWVLQAKNMNLQVGPWAVEASQLQSINPVLIMLLIPLTTSVLYPAFDRLGYPLKPLRRMTIGMFFAALSFVMVAGIQAVLDGGTRLSVLWQAAPYISLTLGEVLVSTTGLEFAYTQAPREMKGTLMAFWSLAVSAGNLVVTLISKTQVLAPYTGATSFLIYAGITAVAGVAMGLIARWYTPTDFFLRAQDIQSPQLGEHIQKSNPTGK
jgi:POT family proton-dependent oligopeptide transporter